MPSYWTADEARELVDEHQLIDRFHPTLRNTRVEYLFVDKTPKRHGQTTLAYATRISGLGAVFAAGPDEPADDFFVVVISHEPWVGMDAATKVALLDHELCHCLVDDGRLVLRPHDLEEFVEIVERRGLWKSDVRRFVEVGAEQMSLALPVPDALDAYDVTLTAGGESVTVRGGDLARAAARIGGS